MHRAVRRDNIAVLYPRLVGKHPALLHPHGDVRIRHGLEVDEGEIPTQFSGLDHVFQQHLLQRLSVVEEFVERVSRDLVEGLVGRREQGQRRIAELFGSPVQSVDEAGDVEGPGKEICTLRIFSKIPL